MSRAYICDRCGRILPTDGDVNSIWITNPNTLRTSWVDPSMELCDECFAMFKREYMENKMDEGEVS